MQNAWNIRSQTLPFHIYIYIYIYIVIHRQTVSLYHNSSVMLDMWDTTSWDWNLPKFKSGWWHTPIALSLACDSMSTLELTLMYQILFVYILCYLMLECIYMYIYISLYKCSIFDVLHDLTIVQHLVLH